MWVLVYQVPLIFGFLVYSCHHPLYLIPLNLYLNAHHLMVVLESVVDSQSDGYCDHLQYLVDDTGEGTVNVHDPHHQRDHHQWNSH